MNILPIGRDNGLMCPRCGSDRIDEVGETSVVRRHYGTGLLTFEYGGDFKPLVLHCRDCGKEGMV